MESLYNCAGRFMEQLDSGGRFINFLYGGIRKKYKTEALLRRVFYNLNLACRDEEVQKRGIIAVCWGVGVGEGNAIDNPDLTWKQSRLLEGTAIRILAVHMCHPDETWNDRIALMRRSLDTKVQVRVRVHCGTVQECLEVLQGHGIHPACIPVDEKGEVNDLMEYRRWLEGQRMRERLEFPLRTIIGVPSAQDVVLGKGTPFQNHPGNKNLRLVVADRYKEYEKALKGAKRSIAQDIVDAIRSNGGLFLKQDGDKWARVDNKVAIVKVSAIFRTLRLKGGNSTIACRPLSSDHQQF